MDLSYIRSEHTQFISYITRKLDMKIYSVLTDLLISYFSHERPIFPKCLYMENYNDCRPGTCPFHDVFDEIIESLGKIFRKYLNLAVEHGCLKMMIGRSYLSSFISELHKLSPTTSDYWIEILYYKISEYTYLLGRIHSKTPRSFKTKDADIIHSVIIELLSNEIHDLLWQ